MDTPLSQSNISLRLAEIQKRCEELMAEQDLTLELEEQPAQKSSASDPYNPYDRAR
jgi:hypothetical protein